MMSGMRRGSRRWSWAAVGAAVLVLLVVGWFWAPAVVLLAGVVAVSLAVPVVVVLGATAALSRR